MNQNMITELIGTNNKEDNLEALRISLARFGDDERFYIKLVDFLMRDVSLLKENTYYVSDVHEIKTGIQFIDLEGFPKLKYNYIELIGNGVPNRHFVGWHDNTKKVITKIINEFRKQVRNELTK